MKISVIVFLFGITTVRSGGLLGGEFPVNENDDGNLQAIQEIWQKTMQDSVTDEEGYVTKVSLENFDCKKQVVAGIRYNCEANVNYTVLCTKTSEPCEEKENWSSYCKASFWQPLGSDAKLDYTPDGKPSCVA